MGICFVCDSQTLMNSVPPFYFKLSAESQGFLSIMLKNGLFF